jgi:hypothetical protein
MRASRRRVSSSSPGEPRRRSRSPTKIRLQTYPEVLFRAVVAIEVLAIALVSMALLFNAPLEGIADPSHTPNPAKAPWYFLGLQEMLHYFPPVVAGVLVPGLGGDGADCDSVFQHQHRGRGFVPERSQAAHAYFLCGRLRSCLFLLLFDVYVALVPTLIVAGFMALASQSSPQSPSAFPALSGRETAFLLDHDLVSVRTGRAHGGWYFLSRPRLVLGVALEELIADHRQKQTSLWQTLFGHPVRAFGVVSLLLLICWPLPRPRIISVNGVTTRISIWR